jgi:ParB family chromosome partitioning protein
MNAPPRRDCAPGLFQQARGAEGQEQVSAPIMQPTAAPVTDLEQRAAIGNNMLQRHPLSAAFGDIPKDEFDQLVADIRKNGLIWPIVYIQDDRGEKMILDGWHRYRACLEAGVKPRLEPFDFVVEPADEQSGRKVTEAEFVVAANGHRRHLTREQKQKIVFELLKAKPEASDRAIAGLAKVDHKTVGAVRREAQATGKIPQFTSRTGRDGKVRAAPKAADQVLARQPAIVVDSVVEMARPAVRPHVANASGNNEWYSPQPFIEAARWAMGSIDTDPASSDIANRVVQATTYFTAEQDGLKQQWRGNVWMNPPYAQPLISDFATALVAKFKAGEVKAACVLVNNATETAWFQALLDVASAVCCVKSRVKFLDPDGNPVGAPLQGQVVIYLGSDPDAFAGAFRAFGKVLYAHEKTRKEEVRLEFERRHPELMAEIEELREKARDEWRLYAERNRYTDDYMTLDEYRLVRSCLHPDREADAERKARAFDIFTRLETRVNPDARRLKSKEWREYVAQARKASKGARP